MKAVFYERKKPPSGDGGFGCLNLPCFFRIDGTLDSVGGALFGRVEINGFELDRFFAAIDPETKISWYPKVTGLPELHLRFDCQCGASIWADCAFDVPLL